MALLYLHSYDDGGKGLSAHGHASEDDGQHQHRSVIQHSFKRLSGKKKPSDIYTSDKERSTDQCRSKSYDIVKCDIVSGTLRQHEKEQSVVSHEQRCDIISKKLLYIIHER